MKLDKNSPLVRFSYWFSKPKETGRYITDAGDTFTDQYAMINYHYLNPTVGITLEKSKVPERTHLCPFFWRTFLLVPLISPFIIVALGIGAVAVAIGAVVAGALPKERPAFIEKVDRKLDKVAGKVAGVVSTIRYSAFWEVLVGMKQKMCPVITFTDGVTEAEE